MTPLYTSILTSHGWQLSRNMKVGDELITARGTSSKVSHVSLQKQVTEWHMTFSDGTSIHCSEKQRWLVRTERDRRDYGIEPHALRHFRGVVKTPRELRENLIIRGGRYNYDVPVIFHPAQFATTGKLPIAPYSVGMLLAQGQTDRIAACGMDTKRIPYNYLFSSIEDRVNLLRGLLSASGTITYASVNFRTTLTLLAQDVQSLAQSLGGIARIDEEKSHGTSFDTWLPDDALSFSDTSSYFVVRMIFPNNFQLFPMSEGVAYQPPWQSQRIRYVTGVQPAGAGEATAITIEDGANLYVINHFLVARGAEACSVGTTDTMGNVA